MLSDKRSESKQWFGSKPRKADTLEETNKKGGELSTEKRPYISCHNQLNT
jgi:hypothetical protein